MATLTIQLFNEFRSSFIQKIRLNNVFYNLRIFWNSRDDSWYMDILDVDLNPLLSGIKLVANYPLIANYDRSFIDNGNFILADTAGFATGDRPTYENLGERYQLIFSDGQ